MREQNIPKNIKAIQVVEYKKRKYNTATAS